MKEWYITRSEEYLAHHGVKGQKWGIRRYQNPDGSLTPEGKARYGIDENGKMSKEGKKLYDKDVGQTAVVMNNELFKLRSDSILSRKEKKLGEQLIKEKYGKMIWKKRMSYSDYYITVGKKAMLEGEKAFYEDKNSIYYKNK